MFVRIPGFHPAGRPYKLNETLLGFYIFIEKQLSTRHEHKPRLTDEGMLFAFVSEKLGIHPCFDESVMHFRGPFWRRA
jgi:hypothetical protein